MLTPRSKLFVPGNQPDKMRKALASAADAISFDLEDAVPLSEKAAARQQVCAFLAAATPAQQIWIRVNSRDSGLLIEDLLALAAAKIDVVNVPKAEGRRDVELVEDVLRHVERQAPRPRPIAIVPTLETARGLNRALEIATASDRVFALQLGTGDIRESTGIVPTNDHLRTLRTMLSLAASEAGVAALDSAFTDIDDPEGFAAAAAEARALGFRGKSCIHPSQIEAANRTFVPTAAEVAEARQIIEAFERAEAEGIGAIKVHGRLVDGPIVDTARHILELAR